jgi:hypothetical protein
VHTVIERRKVETEYEEEFANARDTFKQLEDGNDVFREKSIYVKKITEGSVSRVLVYSEGREQKEATIDKLKEKRFLEDVACLQQSVERGTIRVLEKVAQLWGKSRPDMVRCNATMIFRLPMMKLPGKSRL